MIFKNMKNTSSVSYIKEVIYKESIIIVGNCWINDHWYWNKIPLKSFKILYMSCWFICTCTLACNTFCHIVSWFECCIITFQGIKKDAEVFTFSWSLWKHCFFVAIIWEWWNASEFLQVGYLLSSMQDTQVHGYVCKIHIHFST